MSVSRFVNEERGILTIAFPRVGSLGRRNRVAMPIVRVARPSKPSELELITGKMGLYTDKE